METYLLAEPKEFACLEKEWNELLSHSTADNPFLTHQWIHSWWQTFGNNAEPHILLCREGSRGKGALLGVFPGYVAFSGYPPLRRLRLMGSEVVTSDFLDVIISKDNHSAVVKSMLAHLQSRPRFHIAELTDLRDETPLKEMVESTRSQGWSVEEWAENKACPVIDLPGSPSAYFEGLSRSVRKNFQYYRRRIETKGAYLEIIDSGEKLNQAVKDFTRLHLSRRNQKGDCGIFSSEAQKIFYHKIFKHFFWSGWLELAFLNLRGERIAGVCQFNYGNSIYYYQAGYDVGWEKSSVGFVLTGLLIERAIQQGKIHYEFLRGEEEYKYRLGANRLRNLRDFYWTDRNLFGSVYLLVRRLNRFARNRADSLSKFIPEPWLNVRKSSP